MIDTQKILEEGLRNLREAIIQRSTDAGQRASGRTYDKIEVRNVTETRGELHGPTWVAVLEDGRRPGKVPYDFAQVIMEWATHKGISWASADPRTFERWARGVAWNIRRNGTKLYRSGQTVDVFKTPVAEFEGWLITQLTAAFKTYIANELRTAWKNGK